MKTFGIVALAALISLAVGGALGYWVIPHPKNTETVIDTLAVQMRDVAIKGLRGTIAELAETANRQTLENEKLEMARDFYYRQYVKFRDAKPDTGTGGTIVDITTTSADTSFDNGEVSFDLHAQYTFPPVDEFDFSFSKMASRVKIKREVEYRDVPCEWKFFNGFRVRGDLSAQFVPLDIDGEFELSMPLGINENWRLIPNAGISTLQDFNAGIGLEWGLFVPQ